MFFVSPVVEPKVGPQYASAWRAERRVLRIRVL